ncbi:cytochrome P450 [Mycena maculata]|uniref:Cytochrome P450 n=1 Tax=Mycena maculata TaxID=230809 RepID=A0AAD7ILG9_9AGAR|nr:cytochrome P450 [Mycena maculata]
MTANSIILPITAAFVYYGLYHIIPSVYRLFTNPLRHLGGPTNPSFFLGNFKQMMDDPPLTEKWREEYGSNFMFKGLFSMSQLYTSDIKAVSHILNDTSVYPRSSHTRGSRRLLVGDGLLSLEFEDHKRQRRILNQAFSTGQIRLMTEGFLEQAILLRDMWRLQLISGNTVTCIDVSPWLRRTTLNMLGLAGFNYHFDAHQTKGKPNELDQAFTALLHSPDADRFAVFRLAKAIVPILGFLSLPGTQVVESAREKMLAIASQIVSESKAAIKVSEGQKILTGQKDLLSVLLKSNLSADLPESQRLSDAEVISQIPTFFLAGHETTSSAVSWALHALSLYPALQSKLRDELFTISTENPTMEELNSLTYLESVVREVMRVHSPVKFVDRVATRDDVLPLAKPYIDKQGRAHDNIPIRKGQIMYISLPAVNRDKDIWGDDAEEFKPERWENIPEAVQQIPGVWANVLSFLGGPHNCIGYRFSLAEIKVLLFTLIRAFEFEPATTKGIIVPGSVGSLQPPRLLTGTETSSSLPLMMLPYDPQGN